MQDPRKREDMKLLLSIAAVIVIGAAGIALIAGIGSENPAPARKVTRVSAPAPDAAIPTVHASTPDSTTTPDAEVALAVFRESVTEAADPFAELPAEGPDRVDPAEATNAPAPGPAVEPFHVEPGENLVAGGLSAWEAGDYARAAAYFEAQVAARDTDAWSWYMVGLSRWKNGEPDTAAGAMHRSIELDPDAVKARVNLARIENERGDFAAALAAADGALERFPAHPAALFLRGRSLYNEGRLDEAVLALESSIDGDADNGYAHNLIGLIRIDQQSFDAATDALEVAVELEPDVAFIQNNLGMALERLAERAAAVAAYRRAVELDPQHAKALANLARLEPAGPGSVAPVEMLTEAPVPSSGQTTLDVASVEALRTDAAESSPVDESDDPGDAGGTH